MLQAFRCQFRLPVLHGRPGGGSNDRKCSGMEYDSCGSASSRTNSARSAADNARAALSTSTKDMAFLHTDGVSVPGLYPSRRRSAARERGVKQFTQVAAPSARPHGAKIFRARLRREHEESLKTKKGKE